MRTKAMEQHLVLPIITAAKCTLCGNCISACQYHALAIGESGLTIVLPAQCTYCAECEAACQEHAIACPLQVVWAE